jgi:hypothetical protein
VEELGAAFSSGLAPKVNDPIGAGLLAAGSAEAAPAPPKLKDPIGAAVEAGFVASAGLAPKLKLPNGAGAASVGVEGLPKENGAAVVLDVSAAGLGAPKLNGVGAATTGVEVPESGADLRLKKLGTSPDSLVGAAGVGAAGGLPSPKLKVDFLAVSLDAAGPPNNAAGGATGVGAFEPEREKKPFSLGLTGSFGGVGPVVSGESGSATIDPAASGEDALGRLAFSRERGPRAGTPRLEVEGAAGLLSESDLGAGAAGGGRPKLPNETPLNEGSEILVCSSSSISGRSSSLAENLPPALGEVALDPCAEDPCALFVFSVRALRLDCCLGISPSARGWYDEVDFSLGEGAVSMMVGTEGMGGAASCSGEVGSAVALRLLRPVSLGAEVSTAASLIVPFPRVDFFGRGVSSPSTFFNREERRGVGSGEGSRAGSGVGVRAEAIEWSVA